MPSDCPNQHGHLHVIVGRAYSTCFRAGEGVPTIKKLHWPCQIPASWPLTSVQMPTQT